MIFETFPVGMLACNCTIIGSKETREAIVIDGGDGVGVVMQQLKRLGLHAKYLIHTHAHFDHIADVGGLRERTRAQALLHGADLMIYHDQPRLARMFGLPPMPDPVELDGDLADGDKLTIGSIDLEVLHTPGHTPGSVGVFVNLDPHRRLFYVGDAVDDERGFEDRVGKPLLLRDTDNDPTLANQIVAKLNQLHQMVPELAIIPAHGRSAYLKFFPGGPIEFDVCGRIGGGRHFW